MSDTIQEQTPIKQSLQDRLREAGGRVQREAADKIDKLNKLIEELERERDEARTKYDESLEERDAILEENRKFRSEIAEYKEAQEFVGKQLGELGDELSAKDKRIEELEDQSVLEVLEAGCEMLREGHDGYHIFTTDQIDAAWEYATLATQGTWSRSDIMLVLKQLGIIPCPNNGWVIE